MCWYGIKKAVVAKMDIRVYKIVLYDETKDEIKSYYEKFKYETGKTYTTDLRFDYSDGYKVSIGHGFHSYSPTKTFIYAWKEFNLPFVRISSRTGQYLGIYTDYRTCKINCTIPNGATYYENEFGQIVSNQLRIDSIEELKEGII